MRTIAKAILALAVCAPWLGCGGEEAITDVTKVKPATEAEQKAIRAADDELAREEHANPTPPKKGAKR